MLMELNLLKRLIKNQILQQKKLNGENVIAQMIKVNKLKMNMIQLIK